MTAGISATSANAMLDMLGDPYIQMHTGDPGAAGTSNIAGVATRVAADLGPAAGGVRTLSVPVEWSSPWAGPAQTITHVSGWTAATAGSFLFSSALASHIDLVPGMYQRISVLTVSIPSVAAD